MINEINQLEKRKKNFQNKENNEKNSSNFPFSYSQVQVLTKYKDLNSYDEYNVNNDNISVYNQNYEDKNKFKLNEEKIEENNNYINYNKEDNNINFKNKNKNNNDSQKVFNISKVIKLGRTKKSSNRKGKHNKLAQDNVIRKFKIQLIKNILDYVNSLFMINNYGKSKKPINIIKKTDCLFNKSISKLDNIKWLDSKLYNIFSQKVSIKLSNFDSDYNKKLIVRIFEKKEEKKVIQILNKTIREMLYIYINNDSNKNYPGFKTLKNDITKFKELGENDAYIEMYSLVANSFEIIFDIIKERKKKCKN